MQPITIGFLFLFVLFSLPLNKNFNKPSTFINSDMASNQILSYSFTS